MNSIWYSLFLPKADPEEVADKLRAVLATRDYKPYDPFPGGTGTPPKLSETVRLFVAPSQDDWVRVLGQPVESLLDDFNERIAIPVIYGWLTDEDGGFALYQDGKRHRDPDDFKAYLRRDKSPDLLKRAWEGKIPVPVLESEQPPVAVVNMADLPPDIQELAAEKNVDPKKANKLAERLSATLFGKLQGGSKEEQEQAKELIQGGGRDNWNSLNGQRVRAIAGLLDLPENWRLPALETVRDAYQLHRLREKNPRMPLMPGDTAVMKAIPDALDYRPVYMGR
jgi:hypothetical protein